MKKNKIMWIIFGVLIFSDFVLAAGNNIGSDVVSIYKISTSKWYPIFKQASQYIFWALAVIELIWIFSIKAIEGSLEIQGVFSQLIRLTLIWGVFLNFFAHPEWFDTLISGASVLGNKANAAAGVSTVVSIDTLSDSAFAILAAVGDAQSIWKPASSIVIGLIGIFAAVGVLFLGVKLLMVYVKFLISVYSSVLFFGFSAMGITRHIAINSFWAMLKSALEYMFLKLVIGLSIANITNYSKVAMTDEGSLFALFIIVLFIGGIAQMVGGLVEGWFSGMGTATSDHANSVLKGMAIGAGTGMVGGAAAGLSSVKSAAAAAETKSSMDNVQSATGAGSSTVEQSGKGTNKTGNFKKTKAAGTVAASAMAGMVSGMAKGATGFSHHGAGSKSGAAVASMLTGTPNKEQEKKSSGENDSEKVEGSISASHEKSKYISGVPGGNDDA
ncbi:MAG: hypothetical protein P794_09460 [Epsilonproteobacteria bacterium (ex Lamellibrachia satsuma)]|nr:MAG: hypothetical protein P794_09460 [Epsilonproteobacteria bacterium (ex Lamellibrachia satsuma)]